MANKIIATQENPNGIVVALTADEEAQRVTDASETTERRTAIDTAKADNDALKASAKAKLIAGEALTEDEADTIVL
jgi:hypothetical protein